REPRVEFGARQRGFALAHRALDRLLGLVELAPDGRALGRRQRAELLHLGGERAVLAERARLGVGEFGRTARRADLGRQPRHHPGEARGHGGCLAGRRQRRVVWIRHGCGVILSCKQERGREGTVVSDGGRRVAARSGRFRAAKDAASEAFTRATIDANAGLSATARSASTLRSRPIEARFRPLMNTLYVMPCSRTAALMREIHSERNTRFLARRSRYAYWPARMTACLA